MARNAQTCDYLIERLQALAARLGHTPSQREVDADADSPCRLTYARCFGSRNAALEAAGLPLNRPPMPYDREMLLEALKHLADQLGRAPVTRELVEHGLACQATYTARFGSWEAALAEIGLQPRGSRLYERDELLNVLRDLAEELGHPPSQSELWEREGLPRPTTYKYRFGSWNQALEGRGAQAATFQGQIGAGASKRTGNVERSCDRLPLPPPPNGRRGGGTGKGGIAHREVAEADSSHSYVGPIG